jgi:hypothetical protein
MCDHRVVGSSPIIDESLIGEEWEFLIIIRCVCMRSVEKMKDLTRNWVCGP